MEKSFLGRPLCLLRLAAAPKITHAAHSLPRLGLSCIKGGLCFNLSSRVARLAGAPSLHVNRPLHRRKKSEGGEREIRGVEG